MNALNELQIESLLRLSPVPLPPSGLKERLLRQTESVPVRRVSPAPAIPRRPDSWLRRWWPALAPAAFCLACAAVMTVQQIRINELRQDIATATAAESTATGVPNLAAQQNAATTDAALQEAQEISQLKETIGKLTAEIQQLEQLHAENQNLRAKLSAPPAGFTPEEAAGIEAAKERAQRIACVNNMKQLGLATHVWASDNGDKFPLNIIDMTNEMNTPKILYCPADTGRQMATSFASYTAANCSYEYLAPGETDLEPTRVQFRCPIHGNITLCDGSVQMEIGKTHPEWLVTRDGKLYLDEPAGAFNQRPTPPSGAAPQ